MSKIIPRRSILTAFALVAAVLAFCSIKSVRAASQRILFSSLDGLTFEIELPDPRIVNLSDGSVEVALDGYGSFSPPGSFKLPGKTYHVAIPSSGDATIEFNILESIDLGRLNLSRVKEGRFVRSEENTPSTEYFLPEDRWEGETLLKVAEAGRPSFMSRQRVLPVMINPLYSSEGRFRFARKISVHVDFNRTAGRAEDRIDSFPILSERWRAIYDEVLVNPGDVDRLIQPSKSISRDRLPAEEGKMLKIKIPETGVYGIRADSLISSGLSSSLSNTGFALKKLYYDESEPGLVREVPVPYRIIKGVESSPSIFEGDDLLVFYARGIKDDLDAGDRFATFTDYNLLWIVEDEAGAVMSGFSLSANSGTQTTLFNAEFRKRKDSYYYRNINEGNWDFYYVTGMPDKLDPLVLPFEINDPALLNTFSLTLRVSGSVWGGFNQTITVRIRNSEGTNTVGTRSISGTEDAEFVFTSIPTGYLIDGTNELLVSGSSNYGFLINDFEIVYPAGFAVADDMLEFSLGGRLIPHEITLSGFSAPGGFLLDITDETAPRFLSLPAEDFQLEGSTYSIDLKLLNAARGMYCASRSEGTGHIYNDWISVDNPSSLKTETGPYNAVVISHPDFLPPATTSLSEYAAWREGQGYRILTIDVNDVYDEFNGGLKSSEAIKRFVRFGHDNWGVEFVLLVGDGNEDHKQIFYDESPTKGSPPDYIPPFTYSIDVPGVDYDDEVLSTDKYYSFLDEEWPESGYPDVFVGRMPVGSDLELRALLIKMYRFEDPGIEEQWRRRTVLFADDAWSGYPDYSYHLNELDFEGGMEDIAQDIESSLPGGFDIQRLFLSNWTDSVHNIGESGVAVYSEATDSTRRYFTPYIIARLNEGALFFSFQGHASRSHFTSESGFSMLSQYRDLDRLTSDRNFIFFGAGCHISQYALVMELSRSAIDGPNGDCISEQMLLKSRAGAVSAYASSGFELLDQNMYLFNKLHEVLFKYPPDDSIPPLMEATGAHWNLGEAITKAEIEHIGSRWYGFTQTYRYFILGDPMITVDPGPPLLMAESDWGEGWQEIETDSLRAANGTNTCKLRLTATDVVALGNITLSIAGEDMSEELTITRIGTETSTYARGYYAEADYTVGLEDGSVVFNVYTPQGRLAGQKELVIETGLRFFYNEDIEIMPGDEAPANGDFRIEADFPAFLSEPPLLFFDGVEDGGSVMYVPAGYDSTHWESSFERHFTTGSHEFSVHVGDYSKEFIFEVSGGGLVCEFFSFPNPFSSGTNICFTNNLPIDSGKVMIYDVSGRTIRTLDIPASMLGSSEFTSEENYVPNFIWWDGRDLAGNKVANGSYIMILRIETGGRHIDRKNISVKLE
ncbi:MAG: hypothetical protein JW746_09745 [Candidatus Krumholzibacteriota bacterium]|nr:hypothetical protein [Candidatus Krumholzibacteriota bacterium]